MCRPVIYFNCVEGQRLRSDCITGDAEVSPDEANTPLGYPLEKRGIYHLAGNATNGHSWFEKQEKRKVRNHFGN